MLRKTIVAIAATVAIVVASLPTSASAHKFGHSFGYGLGIGLGLGFVGTTFYANTCRTVVEMRHNARRGYWYEVPVTYC